VAGREAGLGVGFSLFSVVWPVLIWVAAHEEAKLAGKPLPGSWLPVGSSGAMVVGREVVFATVLGRAGCFGLVGSRGALVDGREVTVVTAGGRVG
jgi:hypothetical protein